MTYARRFIKHQWHDDYINLLADPTDKRTNVQFMKDVMISEKSFYNWRKQYRQDIYEEANRRLKLRRNELRIKGWKRLEDMFDDKASGAALKALELYFKLNGDLVERTENRTELLRPEDKRARLKMLLESIANKVGNSNEESREEGEETQEPGQGGDDSAVSGPRTEPGEDSASGGV